MQFKVAFALAFVTLAAAVVPPLGTTPPEVSLPSIPPPKITPPKISLPKITPTEVTPRKIPVIPPPKVFTPFPGNPLLTVRASKCDPEKLQCCKSAQSATAPDVSSKLGPLGVSAANDSGFVGLTCTKITDKTCSAEPLCCTDNSFGGVVSLGCNPVDLSL